MDNVFELKKIYEAGAGQTDLFGLLRPSALVGFMQDVATLHAESFGVSREDLIDRSGVVWLLARQRYFLLRPIRSKETVTVTTWHRKTAGFLWYRDFEFEVSGEVVGGAGSVWITADLKTKKMVDLSAVAKEIGSANPFRSDGPEVKKIRLPARLKYAGAHTVQYSDLDVNAHLNNVKVCDVILNALHLEDRMRGRYIRELQIGYLKESKSGDEITVLASEEAEGQVFVSGECRGERRFESFLCFGADPADETVDKKE